MKDTEVLLEINSWFKASRATLYLVGSQSRSYLLNKVFANKEFDLATATKTATVVRVLYRHRVLPLSVNDFFGIVSFKYQGYLFEVSTFREDVYSPHDLEYVTRYPSKIKFISSIKQDALRRDFTVNALYLQLPTKRLHDSVKGKADLEKKIIRVIGDPELRFKEDPLRILRAVRLKYESGFKYHSATWKAMLKNVHLIRRLHPGVIRKELEKINSLEKSDDALHELKEMGFLPTR